MEKVKTLLPAQLVCVSVCLPALVALRERSAVEQGNGERDGVSKNSLLKKRLLCGKMLSNVTLVSFVSGVTCLHGRHMEKFILGAGGCFAIV